MVPRVLRPLISLAKFTCESTNSISAGETIIEDFKFSEVLHALRESELYKLPRYKVFLSAGCSGIWYFEWIAKACRPVRHIGVELYSPEPEGLPENSQWIAASIGAFPQVPDASIDIVFSGQNIEHLWPADIVGFLLESRRVLKQGGIIAVDTPNRAITGPMNWTHPEHTAEFTVDELHRMFNLAGFDVHATVGHWYCRDEDTDERFPLVPAGSVREMVVAERVSRGISNPVDSFSVWINGLASRSPNAEELDRFVQDVWKRAHRERMSRSTVSTNCMVDGDVITVKTSDSGFLLWGPYVPLLAGHYRTTWKLRLDHYSTGQVALLDVVCNAGRDVKGEIVVNADDLSVGKWADVDIDFVLTGTTFGLEFRINAVGGHRFSLNRHPIVAES